MNEPKRKFIISIFFPVDPERIYHAWLHGDEHGLMTGSSATGSDVLGSSFSAWDGYISGKNIELVPYEKIVQSWRTTEFSEGQEDSLIEIDLRATPEGCELSLCHSNIPEGQPDYETGWKDHYFEPMARYFETH
jgi:uncharacterized protein YndB with AHSA1/START domain